MQKAELVEHRRITSWNKIGTIDFYIYMREGNISCYTFDNKRSIADNILLPKCHTYSPERLWNISNSRGTWLPSFHSDLSYLLICHVMFASMHCQIQLSAWLWSNIMMRWSTWSPSLPCLHTWNANNSEWIESNHIDYFKRGDGSHNSCRNTIGLLVLIRQMKLRTIRRSSLIPYWRGLTVLFNVILSLCVLLFFINYLTSVPNNIVYARYSISLCVNSRVVSYTLLREERNTTWLITHMGFL